MIHSKRAPVPSAVRDQNPEAIFELLNLRVERIDLVAPATVHKDERLAGALFAIVNLDGADIRGKWRFFNGNDRQRSPPQKFSTNTLAFVCLRSKPKTAQS